LLKFKNKLRRIPTSAEEQSHKFSILEQIFAVNVSYKIAASATQLVFKLHFASCLFTYRCSFQLCEHKQKLDLVY